MTTPITLARAALVVTLDKTVRFLDGAVIVAKTQADKTVKGDGWLTRQEVARCFRQAGFLSREQPQAATSSRKEE